MKRTMRNFWTSTVTLILFVTTISFSVSILGDDDPVYPMGGTLTADRPDMGIGTLYGCEPIIKFKNNSFDREDSYFDEIKCSFKQFSLSSWSDEKILEYEKTWMIKSRSLRKSNIRSFYNILMRLRIVR